MTVASDAIPDTQTGKLIAQFAAERLTHLATTAAGWPDSSAGFPTFESWNQALLRHSRALTRWATLEDDEEFVALFRARDAALLAGATSAASTLSVTIAMTESSALAGAQEAFTFISEMLPVLWT